MSNTKEREVFHSFQDASLALAPRKISVWIMQRAAGCTATPGLKLRVFKKNHNSLQIYMDDIKDWLARRAAFVRPSYFRNLPIGPSTPCKRCGGIRLCSRACITCERERFRFKREGKVWLRLTERPCESIGRKYNRLTIIRAASEKGTRRSFVECRCDCGNFKIIGLANIKRGKIKSCGCAARELLESRKLDPEERAIRHVLCHYKIAARNKSRLFTITKNRFMELIKSDCCYCGAAPKMRKLSKKFAATEMNGIDRLDNDLGYVDGNVAPCCGICNVLKGALSMNDWEIRQQHFEHISAVRASKRELKVLPAA